MNRNRILAVLKYLSVLVPVALFLSTTVPGVDYGHHWDEEHGQVEPVRNSLERSVFMPGYYIYPGLGYWLNLAGLTPDVVKAAATKVPVGKIQEDLIRTTKDHRYLLRLRTIRIGLTSLGLVWVFLVLLALDQSPAFALLGALFLGLSWEVAYHSRWLANDTVMMQFGALTLLLATLAWKSPAGWPWQTLTAVVAGLTCGMKYPGGLFLLLLVLVLVLRKEDGSFFRARLVPVLRAVFVFAMTFLYTTPGIVLEPRRFLVDLGVAVNFYARGHIGYTTEAGGPHLLKLLGYLTFDALSPYPWISALFFGLAVLGAVSLVRRSWRTGVVILGVPVLYMLYFCLQRVMIVRNYQVLMPFLAISASLGTATLWRAASNRWLRGAVVAVVLGFLVFNFVWQVGACRSIVGRGDEGRFASQVVSYIDSHPETRFYLTPAAADKLAALGMTPASQVMQDTTGADAVVCRLRDLDPWFPATRRDLITTWFGPREVNLRRYSTWAGDDRFVVVPAKRVAELPLLLPRAWPQDGSGDPVSTEVEP